MKCSFLFQYPFVCVLCVCACLCRSEGYNSVAEAVGADHRNNDTHR